jgi:hypothetical protein
MHEERAESLLVETDDKGSFSILEVEDSIIFSRYTACSMYMNVHVNPCAKQLHLLCFYPCYARCCGKASERGKWFGKSMS